MGLKHQITVGIVFFISICLVCISCFEEDFVSQSDIPLVFSSDTIRFDTVFTTVGSATRLLKIKNTSTDNLIVTSIGLREQSNSMFRINVDGLPGDTHEEVLILAEDSLYVFVEVTVDPDADLSISPYVISELLDVRVGNRLQSVTLEAWGQNANYFPGKSAKGQLIRLTCGGGTVRWDDPRPYVVHGVLFVDSCTLYIPQGTDVYFHGGTIIGDQSLISEGALYFLSQGRLLVDGTAEDPVRFTGDRLEASFSDLAGQWAGIRFFRESSDNVINHARIMNSIVGVRADSAASVSINNSIIYNTSNVGVIGIHADISIDNTLIHSNAAQSCAMVYGGNYRFRHCTIANYQNQLPAVYMDNFVCLDDDCTVVATNPIVARFENTIIMGSNTDELEVNDISEGMDPELVQISLDHTIFRIDEFRDRFDLAASCHDCVEFQDGDVVFVDRNNNDYQLDSASLALNIGVPLDGLSVDLLGRTRDGSMPDLGCYERQ